MDTSCWQRNRLVSWVGVSSALHFQSETLKAKNIFMNGKSWNAFPPFESCVGLELILEKLTLQSWGVTYYWPSAAHTWIHQAPPPTVRIIFKCPRSISKVVHILSWGDKPDGCWGGGVADDVAVCWDSIKLDRQPPCHQISLDLFDRIRQIPLLSLARLTAHQHRALLGHK